MSGAPRAELRLHGSACLQIGVAQHRLERKAAALLCVLAVDGEAARGTLARWLWPGVDAASARRNLRQRVFQLNRRSGRAIVAGRERLCLTEGVECDLAAVTSGAAELGRSGELLGGFAYEDLGDFSVWLAASRRRLAERDVVAGALNGDLREALTAMVGRIESILLADAAREAVQLTSTKWVSKRPARRSAK